MHRLTTLPGGWTPDTEGVIFVEQTPAPIILLTAADTDIQTLAAAHAQLPEGFPAVRAANLLNLQQQLAIDTYAANVLAQAQVIVVRLLGGRAYWAYGLEVVRQVAEQTGAMLLVLPGDDRPDAELFSHSTATLATVNQLWRYLTEGGVANWLNALLFLANQRLDGSYPVRSPQPVPTVGRYPWQPLLPVSMPSTKATVGILFYRAHYLAGNLAPIDALCHALADRNLEPVPVFVSSLREVDVQQQVLKYFQLGGAAIQVLLNATSFSLARLDSDSLNLDLWEMLNVPVLQVIFSSGTEEQWRSQTRGLSPRDMAMNVALPEVDGRIISRAVSFKTVQRRHPALEVDGVGYEPVADRIEWVADLAANWVRLQQTPVGDRHIALILANYPTRDSRLANGVGLDTPASCVAILKALAQAGYTVPDIPQTGDELIQRLIQGVTNDAEGRELRSVEQSLSRSAYQAYFSTLPPAMQTAIVERWGAELPEELAIAGLQLGNVFVGIQPSRGYDLDPSLNYHAPDLEPTHEYLAFYHWLRQAFAAEAIVHVGKHGNLEWLPGKSVALSQTCYPEVALGTLPHLYPFIVNDPGEGAQAKRRAHAVIVDHLTPPMTRAELYGSLQQLEGLIDEYYEAESLNPSRLPVIGDRITTLLAQEKLNLDLATQARSSSLEPLGSLLNSLDGYLCELKEAQIRDGLHIFGQCPTDRLLRDLVVAIARHPGQGRLGLTRSIAAAWGLDLDPLTDDPALGLSEADQIICAAHNPQCLPLRIAGDAIELLEHHAALLIESLPALFHSDPALTTELTWIRDRLLPALQQTSQEITHLLKGLDGGYVPSGASGAPTRGRPDVLPTGRNFYSVDIRALPTESAWQVGRHAAELLIERYTQEQGEYPKTLALSVWGTATMRTGGDDIAEALALLGVQPVWDGASRRVVDFEILPVTVLGRPRVDVTLRISGFFRDAFPNLIDLFHQAVTAIAALDEPAEDNPLAAQVQQETTHWHQQGLPIEQARNRSSYRVFGSKPGAYGAGLQGLIEAQNWTDDRDLARAYINWSSYAYTGHGDGHSAPDAFETRLQHLQVVLHNQDNREHDLLDSDDYYQFQGGLTAAVRSATGRNPTTYFGDHSLPERPRVRSLAEEVARVYRSRVVNPKWIAGVMRHGYKGAFEMAATVDYLFAYDATAHCVQDHMYEGVAQAYLLDPSVQNFVQKTNPWALRDMAERLLEANQRGLWQAPTEMVEQMRSLVLQAEGVIESGMTGGL